MGHNSRRSKHGGFRLLMIEVQNKRTKNTLIYLNSFLIDGKIQLLLMEKISKQIILVPKDNYEWKGEEK